MKITEKLLTEGKPAHSGRKFEKKLERIVIHWIGAYPHQTVETPWRWWEYGADGKGVEASAHFIVKDKQVLQCLSLSMVGWHSGDYRNFDSIGIEVIPKNTEGEFSKETIGTLRELIQYIRNETRLPLTLERHYDGKQKKDCPRYYTAKSEVITKDANGEKQNGDQRWKELEMYLNGGTNE
jgi:N-acetyl-anhydromuramyl-L-alanine amidase AmpD